MVNVPVTDENTSNWPMFRRMYRTIINRSFILIDISSKINNYKQKFFSKRMKFLTYLQEDWYSYVLEEI